MDRINRIHNEYYDPDRHFDDRYSDDAGGSAAERSAIDDGQPIPEFLRRDRASAASQTSSAPSVEQGIFDILYEDYDLRPSARPRTRSPQERAERRNIFRRALDAVASRFGGERKSAARPRDVRWGDDPDYVPTPRFSHQAQGPNQTGNRWRQTGPNIWTLETEGNEPMDEQLGSILTRVPRDRVRDVPAAIGDAELDAFAAKVRSYVDENRILNEHIKKLEQELSDANERIKNFEDKHRQIQDVLHNVGIITPCEAATPATPA